MRDKDTPLCECSGFQRTGKGRGGGREFREQSPRILKFSPTLVISFPYLSYINIANYKTKALVNEFLV